MDNWFCWIWNSFYEKYAIKFAGKFNESSCEFAIRIHILWFRIMYSKRKWYRLYHIVSVILQHRPWNSTLWVTIACERDFNVFRNNMFKKYFDAFNVCEDFRNHANKTLFELYNFSQKDRNHANKTFSKE